MSLGTVGEHGPDLALAGTRGFKNKMAPIGGPTGTLVAALVAGEFEELPGRRVHDVKVVVVVRATPTESQQLAVRRPSGVNDIAFVGHVDFRDASAVDVHQVELGCAAAVADEGDGLSGLGIPRGRHVCAAGLSKALGTIAVDVTNIKLRVPLNGRRKDNLRAVGRPGRRDVDRKSTRLNSSH